MQEDNAEEFFADDENLENIEDMAISVFRAHLQSTYCVEIHPNRVGIIISGGGDDKGYIWKYCTSHVENTLDEFGGNILSCHELGGHTDTVTAVGFSFDGVLAFTAGYDGVIKIWDVETGELKATVDGPQDVEWAHWHSKGRAIVAGSSDGTAWMWVEVDGNWQCMQVFAGAHEGGVSSGCFSQDGKFVCTGGQDGSIRIWAPKTGKCKHTFSGHFAFTDEVTCVVSSSDGDLLLAGSMDGRVRLLQLSGKRVLQTFVHSTPEAVAVDPASASSTTADSNAEAAVVREGDLLKDTSGAALPSPPTSNMSAKNKVASTAAAVMETSMDVDDGMYDEDGERTDEAPQQVLSVECVGFAAGGRLVASGGMDRSLKIWGIVTGALRHSCRHGGGVVALKWHVEVPLVATAALDKLIRLWDARSGVCVKEFTGHTNLVTQFSMSRLVEPSMPIGPGADAGNGGNSALVADTDVIASVSDDGTVRVFHFNALTLIS